MPMVEPLSSAAQVSAKSGIFYGMEPSKPSRSLSVVENVRCLECGAVYTKPSQGGTVKANPGCPDCGYLGWLAVSVPLTSELARRRSGADRPHRRSAQSR